MPATNELLLEEIRKLEESIHLLLSEGRDVTDTQLQLKELQRRLQASNEALNEGRKVLLG